MNITLDDNEVRILHELLESDLKDLLREIAHTDHREFRAELQSREAIVHGILKRLQAAPVA